MAIQSVPVIQVHLETKVRQVLGAFAIDLGPRYFLPVKGRRVVAMLFLCDILFRRSLRLAGAC